jgi:hypothetical protein
MNVLLYISILLLILSLGGIVYVIKKANKENELSQEYTTDIDQVLHDFLRSGGKRVKNTFGFIILGILSLYRIISSRIAKINIIQKVLEKIQL